MKTCVVKAENSRFLDHSTETIRITVSVTDALFYVNIVKAIERLKSYRETHTGKQQFLAMYSSMFGGITTDPAAMVIPVDDHMVHRGHGVFDTAAIMDGLVILFPHDKQALFMF